MLGILLLSQLTTAQLTSRFTYDQHPELTWTDFAGEPPHNAVPLASANTGISYIIKNLPDSISRRPVIEVSAHFYSSLSWRKSPQVNDLKLLKHEQLHYDISELHARKLRLVYKRYIPQENISKEVRFIFEKFEKERQAMQRLYDKETRHGRDASKQAYWESYVTSELFKL
jgi:hypothetical protein